jgi:hypothetical protein
MSRETIQPSELVGEFRTRLRISVWCIKRRYDNTFYCRFDLTTFCVAEIAGQRSSRQNRRCPTREDGDAIPSLLAPPDGFVTRPAYCVRWKLRIRRLELLEADHVRFSDTKPMQKICEALIDVVDVERGNFHLEGC